MMKSWLYSSDCFHLFGSLQGALDMKNKTVKDAMLPLCDVFMIDVNSVMDKATMCKV